MNIFWAAWDSCVEYSSGEAEGPSYSSTVERELSMAVWNPDQLSNTWEAFYFMPLPLTFIPWCHQQESHSFSYPTASPFPLSSQVSSSHQQQLSPGHTHSLELSRCNVAGQYCQVRPLAMPAWVVCRYTGYYYVTPYCSAADVLLWTGAQNAIFRSHSKHAHQVSVQDRARLNGPLMQSDRGMCAWYLWHGVEGCAVIQES